VLELAMEDINRVVVRFSNGKILKGYVRNFVANENFILLEEVGTKTEKSIPFDELKAIFFVKTFEGVSGYRDKKAYGIRQSTGRKVYLRFNDGESMVGFLEGEVPWKKGFFLSKPTSRVKGFFLIPVDSESNNIKVFVVGSSIKDITLMP
jgi:small nuclear ribonucleoprotein (snRNP)-like protein